MSLSRHPALVPLSRAHHAVLQLARGIQRDASPHLRRTLPADPRALAEHVGRVFEASLAAHFELEEWLVMDLLIGLDADVDALCQELEQEHVHIRALLARLELEDENELGTLLDRLGKALEAHVRREERELFAQAQYLLAESTLERIGAAIRTSTLDRAADSA